MKRRSLKRILSLCLLVVFLAATAVPGIAAENELTVTFNGSKFNAEVYIEEGVSFIATDALEQIYGIEVDVEEGHVPLRSFFEGKGAAVGWDGYDRSISISLNEWNGDWNANELVMEAEQRLKDYNTYKLSGNAIMEMIIKGEGFPPETQTMDLTVFGAIQQEPLAMYIMQEMAMPFEEMGLTEEEAQELFGGDASMVTEMVWTDMTIYQKMPFFGDQWIAQDLEAMGMTEYLNQMLQVSPQQSLEMLADFGVYYVFGEDVLIDGNEYYTVYAKIGSKAFKELMEELMPAEQLSELGPEVMLAMEQILNSMEIDYTVEMLIHKEKLVAEYLNFNMYMGYSIDDDMMPDGPVDFTIKMTGSYNSYDFGQEIEIPDVSDAITQEEFIEQQMMLQMELMPEPPAE